MEGGKGSLFRRIEEDDISAASHLSPPPSPISLRLFNTEWEGDTEIEVTPWQEVNQGVGATRTIHFFTSLEVSIGKGVSMYVIFNIEPFCFSFIDVHSHIQMLPSRQSTSFLFPSFSPNNTHSFFSLSLPLSLPLRVYRSALPRRSSCKCSVSASLASTG